MACVPSSSGDDRATCSFGNFARSAFTRPIASGWISVPVSSARVRTIMVVAVVRLPNRPTKSSVPLVSFRNASDGRSRAMPYFAKELFRLMGLKPLPRNCPTMPLSRDDRADERRVGFSHTRSELVTVAFAVTRSPSTGTMPSFGLLALVPVCRLTGMVTSDVKVKART